MSTRSHVAFFETPADKVNMEQDAPNALLYRHCDGYPSGMLPDLVPFLVRMHNARGLEDPSYASARCMQALCNAADEIMDRSKNTGQQWQEQYYYVGYGFCPDGIYHSDVEYVYAVHGNGLLRVYKTSFWNGLKRFTLIGEILVGTLVDDESLPAKIEEIAETMEAVK